MKKYLMTAAGVMALAGMLGACGSDDDNKDKQHQTEQTDGEGRDDAESGITGGGTAGENGETDGEENGHGYVDMGLSVKWATVNVGAKSPDEFGDYFAWGEVIAYGKGDKSNENNLNYTGGNEVKTYYYWETYAHCDGTENIVTAYNLQEAYGTVDGNYVLSAEDDAATENWGGKWRTPTRDEWETLIDNTRSEWVTINGVEGMKFTSKRNGSSIFIPAVGFREKDELLSDGHWGSYWSATLGDETPARAFGCSFSKNGSECPEIARCLGLAVRGVVK